jgi:hypothetical protein
MRGSISLVKTADSPFLDEPPGIEIQCVSKLLYQKLFYKGDQKESSDEQISWSENLLLPQDSSLN